MLLPWHSDHMYYWGGAGLELTVITLWAHHSIHYTTETDFLRKETSWYLTVGVAKCIL